MLYPRTSGRGEKTNKNQKFLAQHYHRYEHAQWGYQQFVFYGIPFKTKLYGCYGETCVAPNAEPQVGMQIKFNDDLFTTGLERQDR